MDDDIDAHGYSPPYEDPPRKRESVVKVTKMQGRVTVQMNAVRYKMTHGRRGTALIFNHKKFDHHKIQDLDGTDIDRDRLKVYTIIGYL